MVSVILRFSALLNVIKLCRIVVAFSSRGLVWDALSRVLGGGRWARLLRFLLFCLRMSKVLCLSATWNPSRVVTMLVH